MKILAGTSGWFQIVRREQVVQAYSQIRLHWSKEDMTAVQSVTRNSIAQSVQKLEVPITKLIAF